MRWLIKLGTLASVSMVLAACGGEVPLVESAAQTSALTSSLNDGNCSQCHALIDPVAHVSTMSAARNWDVIGIKCASCHGDSAAHLSAVAVSP